VPQRSPEAVPVCAVAVLYGVAPLAPNQRIQLFAKVGIPPAGATGGHLLMTLSLAGDVVSQAP
jgi:hypothetical protein